MKTAAELLAEIRDAVWNYLPADSGVSAHECVVEIVAILESEDAAEIDMRAVRPRLRRAQPDRDTLDNRRSVLLQRRPVVEEVTEMATGTRSAPPWPNRIR